MQITVNKNQKKSNLNRLIVGYVRESTKEQAEYGYNLKDQEKKIRAYYELYSDELPEGDIHWLIEAGASAKTLNRPKMNELIELIKQGKVSYVIIHNLDRLTRRVKDLSILLELFEKYDVKLISITERIDTSSAQGVFFVYLIILISQWEQDTISERTKRGVYESARQGNYAKSPTPFGYQREGKKLIKAEDVAPIVDDLMQKLLSNQFSTEVIAIYMKETYPVLNWTKARIENIAKNPIYAGIYIDKEKTIYNHSPAYITPAQHDTILQNIRYRKTNEKPNYMRYVYKNFVICKECGCHCQQSSTVKKKHPYFYYCCPLCKRRVNQDKLNEMLKIELNALLNEEYKEKNIGIYEAEKKKLNARIAALDQSLSGNLITTEQWYEMMTDINTQLVEMNEKIEYHKTRNSP